MQSSFHWKNSLLLAAIISFAISESALTPRSCGNNEKRPENKAACEGLPFGTLVSYPDDCNRFLVCNCEYPTVMKCGGDLWFNDILKTCDWPQNVKCEPSVVATSTSSTSSTNTPTTTSSVPVECVSTPVGVSSSICQLYDDGTLLPYAHNCNAYMNCTLRCPALLYCPPDKLFNPSLSICDTPEAVDCADSTTTDPPTSPTLAVVSDDLCYNLPSHLLLPYIGDCAAYVECMEGRAQLRHCPAERLFNPDLRICDYAEHVQCFESVSTTTQSTQTTTTPTLTSTPPTTTTTTLNPGLALCRGKVTGTTYVYQDDCSFYYYCSGNDEVLLLSCPHANYYNPHTGNCGTDVSADACRASVTTTPATTLTPAERCRSQAPGQTLPLDSNCAQYIMCTRSGAMRINCPNNNYYDPATGNCGPTTSPDACRSATTETTTEPSTEPTTPWPTYTDGVCGAYKDGERVPYPSNCNKYISCEYPVPIAYDCGADLEFSMQLQKCTTPDEANCKGPATTTIATTISSTTEADSDTSPVITPTTEAPITDGPTTETPTTEAPTTEAPTTETPTTETPTTEAATTEAPITDVPTTETPTTETPTTETPTTETPTTETPTTETPTTETPTTETPTTETPTVETPITQTSTTVSSTDLSTTDTPTTESPETESPLTKAPTGETPITEISTTEIPPTELSTTETPSTEPPITETPPNQTTVTPNTPPPNENVCCGQPFGTRLPFPGDVRRYIVCDYPVPIVVTCPVDSIFDDHKLECAHSASCTCTQPAGVATDNVDNVE